MHLMVESNPIEIKFENMVWEGMTLKISRWGPMVNCKNHTRTQEKHVIEHRTWPQLQMGKSANVVVD